MQVKARFRHVSPILVSLALILSLIGGFALAHSPPSKGQKPNQRIKPWIKIVHAPNIPPGPDQTGTLSGKVGGINSINGLAIVLWARGAGTWYVQPTTAAPYTAINPDRTFSNDTHGADGAGYAAFLVVKKRYQPVDTLSALPAVDGRTILAVTTSGPK
jgi:hypothetical protein